MSQKSSKRLQQVTVFQQRGSGERKIAGVRAYGGDVIELKVISIDDELPLVLDDTSNYLPSRLDTDLVLDFLSHHDLSADLAELCIKEQVPMISSGKKIHGTMIHIPPT